MRISGLSSNIIIKPTLCVLSGLCLLESAFARLLVIGPGELSKLEWHPWATDSPLLWSSSKVPIEAPSESDSIIYRARLLRVLSEILEIFIGYVQGNSTSSGAQSLLHTGNFSLGGVDKDERGLRTTSARFVIRVELVVLVSRESSDFTDGLSAFNPFLSRS